eukprot:9354469-Lingulodinium_polyedra.AAC.1
MARRPVFRYKREAREADLSARQSAQEYLDQLIFRIPGQLKTASRGEWVHAAKRLWVSGSPVLGLPRARAGLPAAVARAAQIARTPQ